jgi:PKD repeat protein
MRVLRIISTTATLIIFLMLVSCNNGTYSNPSSPDTTPSEWRTSSVTSNGGTVNFSEIGMQLFFPEGAINDGETFTFSVRAFPPDIPLLPSGPVLVRLGTFELTGTAITFNHPVEVRFPIAEYRSSGIMSAGFMLNSEFNWESHGNAPVLEDGLHAIMTVTNPGTYGAFEAVPLHVEITVNHQSGPLPLSVAFKAIVTGGMPPYDASWDFGDNQDPRAGLFTSHAYVDPGDYTATVLVKDGAGNWVSDWIFLSAYAISSPPQMP